MAQWSKDSVVTAVAQFQSLAQRLLHAAGTAKKIFLLKDFFFLNFKSHLKTQEPLK